MHVVCKIYKRFLKSLEGHMSKIIIFPKVKRVFRKCLGEGPGLQAPSSAPTNKVKENCHLNQLYYYLNLFLPMLLLYKQNLKHEQQKPPPCSLH